MVNLDRLNVVRLPGFCKIATEIGKTIRVFSLNYDQCFEKVIGEDNVEQGFDPKTYEWQQANFEEERGKLFKLYKLHGSINWYTDNHTGKLMHSNHPIDNNPQLIFGIDTKLRSNDPFFYYTSEFRRLLLSPDCKLIVTIGYSYADQYINNLIAQAIINNPLRQVLNITYLDKNDSNLEKNKSKLKQDITQDQLELKYPYNEQGVNQFNLHIDGAKDFLTNIISTEFFTQYFRDDTEAPFDV